MKNTRGDHSSLCKQGDMVASTMIPKSEKSPLTQTTVVKILTSELVALPGARTKKGGKIDIVIGATFPLCLSPWHRKV